MLLKSPSSYGFGGKMTCYQILKLFCKLLKVDNITDVRKHQVYMIWAAIIAYCEDVTAHCHKLQYI